MNPPATSVDTISRAATPPLVGVAPCSALLAALEELTAAHPTARKWLVGPDVNFGRELLVALARRTGGWVGWEATNLRGIAESLAFVPLAEGGVRAAGDVEVQALIGRALDDAVAAKLVDAGFAALSRSLGFRGVLGDALLELRAAGLGPDDVRCAAPPGSPAAQLAPVLAQYEQLLDRERLADPATIFRAALDAFDREAPFVLGGTVALAPSLSRRGLPGELLQRLLDGGGVVLDADVPAGIEAPEHVLAASRGGRDAPRSPLAFVSATRTPDASQVHDALARVDLFAGATPSEELREVARRVVAEGVRWDEVEIVATDPDAYGIALDALCQRLDLGATMLRGLPLARTRLGRALERWLAWLDDGLPADVLREALEAGELGSPLDGVAPTRLAHELRWLRIGWGRARWEAALERVERGEPLARMTAREGESDDELARRRESRARALEALAALLRALLAGTPAVPERGSDRPVGASCATLARATLSWLLLVPLHGPAEEQAAERLRTRLEQLAEVRDEATTFAVAMATLRDGLADLRAWPLVTSDRKPWSAAGGMPHLTDVAHAGSTGRRRAFVVGLDADRTGGPATQDPLLPDAVRRALGLATTADRRDEHAWTLATSLAALRGRVTLSYATSTTLDGREAGPSPLLLQAWRIARHDAALSYDDLRAALRPPASPVPSHSDQVPAADIDARDVWLDALADGPLLLDGSEVVDAAYPMLAAGLAARETAQGTEVGAHHGIVADAGAVLDPTARPDREISPSSLETMAKCPLAWFYRYGLAIYPPQDPEYDPECWVDALQRGSLLHEVFETFTREYQPKQQEIGDDAARERIVAITRDIVARWRDEEPPPSESVFAGEAEEIERAALAFLEMERERLGTGDRARWLHFELELGASNAAYALGDGRALLVRGRVDRVDELADGTLRVVDYKTGSAKSYARTSKTPPFNGGKQLQPALYAAAVEAVCGKPVAGFEYRFPTERGQNETVAYAAGELAAARSIVGSLLDQVRAGEFIPTVDPADCSYCDYQAICRARRDGWDTESPRAEWAKANAPQLPVYAPMLARRTNGGGE